MVAGGLWPQKQPLGTAGQGQRPGTLAAAGVAAVLSCPVLSPVLCRSAVGTGPGPFFVSFGELLPFSAPQGRDCLGRGQEARASRNRRPSHWGRVRRGSNSRNPKSLHQPPCKRAPLRPAQSSASAFPPWLACCWVSPVPQLPRAPEHRAGPPAPPALCVGVLSNWRLGEPTSVGWWGLREYMEEA